MENDEVLQDVVDNVYQKTLMTIPDSDTLLVDSLDDDFIRNFIAYFSGSRLDGIAMENSTICHTKIEQLFRAIEIDLYNVRIEHTDVSTLSEDKNTLRMYLEGRQAYDESVRRAFHNVQNMSATDSEAAGLLEKVYEKKQASAAYRKNPDSLYESYTRDEIRSYFVKKGIIVETTDDGERVDVIDPDKMQSQPTEVEKLMGALSNIVKNARNVRDMDDCLWAGKLAMSGYTYGDSLGRDPTEQIEEGDAFGHAFVACYRVACDAEDKYSFIAENTTEHSDISLATATDPYMNLLFDLIQSGKVEKGPDGNINLISPDITEDEVRNLCNKVIIELFKLGPNNKDAAREPVKFDDAFDTRITKLKVYIDFLNSSEIDKVIGKVSTRKDTNNEPVANLRNKLIAAYILIKSVHDTFNGCIMTYSPSDAKIGDYDIPSCKKFYASIDKNCEEYKDDGIDRDYIFNYKIMFLTNVPHFPIERIIAKKPNLYVMMHRYAKDSLSDYASRTMTKYRNENKPVVSILDDFVESFNRNMNNIARVDEDCENPVISREITPTQYVYAFNAVSNGIAYAGSAEINDKVTEYRLWSLLKVLASRAPAAFGDAVKKELINAAHAEDDFMFRMNLAKQAGVITSKGGFHFSGNLGTVEDGGNVQADRINRAMRSFYVYVNGLLFKNTNAVLARINYPKRMGMKAFLPYLAVVNEIAKEYNSAFNKNHAKLLGCSDEYSNAINDVLDMYFMGG